MKSKSTIITLVLAAAVLILGIAYASLAAQTLTVDGSATVATKPGNGSTNPGGNFDVEFVDKAVVTAETTGHVTAVPTINHNGDENVAFLELSNFTTKGDKAKVTYTIANTSPVDDIYAQLATDIKMITDEDTEADWFKITANVTPSDTALAPDCSTTEDGPYATLTIEVELLKTPINESDVAKAEASLQVTVNATPVHAS